MALEVFASIQSSNGSGLSTDVAKMLVMTLTSAQKLDKAVQVLNLCIKRKVSLATPPIAELLQACYKFGKFDTVFKIFALYGKGKHTPKNFMFTTAMLSAHNIREIDLPRFAKGWPPLTSQKGAYLTGHFNLPEYKVIG